VVITKFEDILTDLDEALDFARSLGVKVAGSRFELYRDRIAEWVRLVPQRGLPEPSGRDDRLDSVALTEAVELGQDIVPFLRDVDPVIAANKLRHLFRGADRPGDDDSDSAMGRNLAFEISLAETFRRARIPVKLGEPDLVAQIGRRQIFIACKRPFGPAGVERNFMRAEEQVKRQLLPSGDRGAIAMSLTGVVVPRNSWLRGARRGRSLSEARSAFGERRRSLPALLSHPDPFGQRRRGSLRRKLRRHRPQPATVRPLRRIDDSSTCGGLDGERAARAQADRQAKGRCDVTTPVRDSARHASFRASSTSRLPGILDEFGRAEEADEISAYAFDRCGWRNPAVRSDRIDHGRHGRDAFTVRRHIRTRAGLDD
jgi:hypothetical protein